MPKTKEERKKYRREYYLKHKKHTVKTVKEWQKKNPEKAKSYKREYYLKNKEHIIKMNRSWQEENKEKVREYQRRSKRRNNPKKVYTSQRRVLEFAKSLKYQLEGMVREGAMSEFSANVLWTTMGLTYYSMYKRSGVSNIFSQKIKP